MKKIGVCIGVAFAADLFFAVTSLFAEEIPGFRNGDFESFDEKGKTVGWYAPRPFQILRGAGSNGSCGAVYEVTEPGKADGHLSQRVPVEPGAIYTFGAWAKAENVGGKGPAFVVIGFRDANGKWLGESRSTAVRKSTDGWIKLEGLSCPAPTSAATAGVAIVVQDTLTGRFSFDKVYFERHMPQPVAGVWCDTYRNEATDGEVSFAAALSPEAFGAKPEDVKAIFAVRGPDGGKFAVAGTMPSADEARVTIAVDRFPVGTNEVVCALKAGERVIGKARMAFVRTATPTPRKVSFDRYGRTVVDGKLVFPYGMYTGRTFFEGTNFERYCEAPFNCFMEYGHPTRAELDRCAKAGIWSIQNIAAWYGQPDAGTNSVQQMMKVKDHPALLGWYMFDELPTSMVPILEARYRYVVENDPHHPVWCAQDIPSEARHYLGSIDVFGCDPYPVSTRPVSLATDWIRTERKQLMGLRPIWQVVQFFGWNWHDPKQAHQRRPTEAELRNMTWQAIAGGARGLIYYAYGYLCTRDELAGEKSADIWEEMKRVAREVKAHERVLLFAETADVPGLPEGVVGRTFRENGETWTLLVNTTEKPVPSLGLAPLEVRMKQ